MHSSASLTAMIVAVAVALMIIGSSGMIDGAVVPPAHCNPDVSEALPPRLRRICAALYGIAEISNAVEQYLDDKTYRDSVPIIDSGVKRQDVDHVFLRFGKR